MKLRYIFITLITLLSAVSMNAQTRKTSGAHTKAHSELLANHKSSIDKSTVGNFLKNEIEMRESAAELSIESRTMIDDMLKEANRYIGRRYQRGAKGPHAFDCSGFSSYIYKQFGYTLSPSSRAQYTQGAPVAKGDLRKGDLVFFTSRGSGKNVGHVGIVVSADNEKGTFKFIHAATSGIKIDSNQGYYQARYIGARRVITD